MDLRPRQRQHFSGFTEAEIQRMDCLLKESKEKVLDQDFCKKLAKVFNRSKGRAGKPIVKWTEVQNWFQNRQQNCLQTDTPADAFKVLPDVPEPNHPDKAKENSQVQKVVYIAAFNKGLSFVENKNVVVFMPSWAKGCANRRMEIIGSGGQFAYFVRFKRVKEE